MKSTQFATKTVLVEAIQWYGGNFDEVMNFMGWKGGHKSAYEDAEELANRSGKIFVRKMSGTTEADKLDWIIKGVDGTFSVCKPDVFDKMYEKVMDHNSAC